MARVGTALRSARERAGWSREALAYHSGLSLGAIAQIESGRRQDVRLASLVALGDALEVSVDYLVGGEATMSPRLFEHRALIYGSDDEFLAIAVAFLAGGIRRSECALAITTPQQTSLLQESLGDEAAHVEFHDSGEWYRSPRAALDAYRTFVKERFELGAPWIRIVGEPVWAGRTDAEVAEWVRYESLLNMAFASAPATMICPYDRGPLLRRSLLARVTLIPRLLRPGSSTSVPYIVSPRTSCFHRREGT